MGFAFFALIIVCFSFGYFVGVGDANEFFKSLIYSILASYIFFFLTVTLREKSERKKQQTITTPLLRKVVSQFQISIHNCILYPNSECRPMPDVKKLNISEIEHLIDFERLNVKIKGFKPIFLKSSVARETYIDQLVIETTIEVEYIFQEIQPYFYMLEHDIVEILTSIQQSTHAKVVGQRLKYRSEFFFDKNIFLEAYSNVLTLEKAIESQA